ncbi:hypothetical protein INT43_005415 [Umbelopsis isabellina]|uniref:HORMA domain-containing protein n=1 Tax=Mortierella isabellina TaxID=91625 RepID=A0A8H7UC68_MORIS|nr:hypothetical protein INT43_005415 [Umbelopsis isabellina]
MNLSNVFTRQKAKSIMDASDHQHLMSVILVFHSNTYNVDQESEQYEFIFENDNGQQSDLFSLMKCIAMLMSHLQNMKPLADRQHASLKMIYNNATPPEYKCPFFCLAKDLPQCQMTRYMVFRYHTGSYLLTLNVLNAKYYRLDSSLLTHQNDHVEKQKIITLDANNNNDDVHNIDSHCSECVNTENVEELFSSLFTETREDIIDVIHLAYGIPPDVMKIICPALGHHRCHRSVLANSAQHGVASTSHPANKHHQSAIKAEEIEPTIHQLTTNCICGTRATLTSVNTVSS